MSKKAAKTVSQMIARHVKKVLTEAARSPDRPYLTAYQILQLLPPKVRDELIDAFGRGGDKAYTHHYAATQAVKDAARSAANDIAYLKTDGLEITIAGKPIPPSGKTCALYRRLRVSPKKKSSTRPTKKKSAKRSDKKKAARRSTRKKAVKKSA